MNQMINSIFEQTSSDWVTLTVSFDKLTDYLITINESHPLYTNKTIAIQAGYSNIPLPQADPSLFWQLFTLTWLEKQTGVILTAKEYYKNKTSLINQHYKRKNILKKLITRKNKQWAIHQLVIYQETKLIATVETTLLLIKGASQ